MLALFSRVDPVVVYKNVAFFKIKLNVINKEVNICEEDKDKHCLDRLYYVLDTSGNLLVIMLK